MHPSYEKIRGTGVDIDILKGCIECDQRNRRTAAMEIKVILDAFEMDVDELRSILDEDDDITGMIGPLAGI